jgi:hypothetical protein
VTTSLGQPTIADQGLFCPECQYDLRGISSERCPECGLAFDRAQLSGSRIPWLHRHETGSVRAYIRTVVARTRGTEGLAAEMVRPVSLRQAQLFRWVTVITVFVPVCATVPLLRWYVSALSPQAQGVPGDMGPWIDLIVPLPQGYSYWPLISLCLLLLIVGLTGVASYWFHPRTMPVELQNRAVAMSYYTCAPMVWLAPCALVYAAIPWLSNVPGLSKETLGMFLVLSMAVAVVTILGWWVHVISTLRGTTQSSTRRVMLAMAGIPLSWLLVAFLTLVALPWCVGFVVLFFQNLP